MKIGGYTNVAGTRPLDRSRPASRSGAGDSASPSRADLRAVEIDDFFGIPAAELTPKVREAILKLMSEVEHLRQELDAAERRNGDLKKLADQDPLVPLVNRRAFVREMSRMISYTERYGTPSSLVFFDVNGLKALNDRYGHAAGDKALVAVAQALVDHVRHTDVIGRIGGDEFGVILAQASEEAARRKAEELAQAIRTRPVDLGSHTIHLEVAHGVFPFENGSDASAALAEADRRMYQRKQEMKEVDVGG